MCPFGGLKLPPLEPGWGKMPTPRSSWPPQKCPSAITHFSHVPVTFRRRQASHRHLPAWDPPFPLHLKLHTSPVAVRWHPVPHTPLWGFPCHLPINEHSTLAAANPLMKANKPLLSSAGHIGELSSTTRTPSKLLCHTWRLLQKSQTGFHVQVGSSPPTHVFPFL